MPNSSRKINEVGARVARVVRMLALFSGQPYSLDELCDEFQVSRRTIFRDIRLMRSAGYPLERIGPNGEYALPRQATFRCPQLEADELAALLLVLEASSLRNSGALKALVDRALGKIRTGCLAHVRSHAETALKRIVMLHDSLTADDAVRSLLESWCADREYSLESARSARNKPTVSSLLILSSQAIAILSDGSRVVVGRRQACDPPLDESAPLPTPTLRIAPRQIPAPLPTPARRHR